MRLVNLICISLGLFLIFFATTISTVYPQKMRKKSSEITPLQSIAINALDSATYELRDVEPLSTRIELAEGIVSLLARQKPGRCRQLLDSIFDSLLQLRKTNSAEKPTLPLQDTDSLMRRVIKMAAAVEPRLAKSYADKYAAELETNTDSKTPSKISHSAADLYLRLATELVDSEPSLALSIAERAIVGTLEPSALIFLETLRKKNVTQANEFFTFALQSVVKRQANDINEMFLLYSYVFSPLLAPVVVPEGLSINYGIANYRNIVQSRPVDPGLAKQFLQLSTQLMLDPGRYKVPVDLPSLASGDLYFIRIIEPQVATYMPTLAEPLVNQELLLANYLDSERRASLQKSTDRFNASVSQVKEDTKEGSTSIEARLRQADETSDPDEKDQRYYMIATNAVTAKKYDLALNIVDKLSPAFLDNGKQFIMFSIAEAEIKDNHLERAEQWARRDSDLVRRAFILNLIANALVSNENKDLVRAAEILSEVEGIARKLESGQQKIATLIGAAGVYSKYDSSRAAELLRESIDIANKVEKFMGDTRVSRAIEIGGFGFLYYMYYDQLTFSELLKRRGQQNFTSTLADLQNLKNRIPRIKATIDLCGAVISPKPSSNM